MRVKVVAIVALRSLLSGCPESYRSPTVARMAGIEGLNAVTLATADMAASVRFYESAGFAVVVGGADAPFTTFRAGAGFLNLQLDAAHAPVPSIWGRAIFWVADVDATHAALVAAGYSPAMPPSDAVWGERYFHVLDPSGHEISFARPLTAP
jgi:catechol 2,3-dioxygenase-like lactoylglutathione lyase family enzyme